jgi:arylsulfatase A-like enzyme
MIIRWPKRYPAPSQYRAGGLNEQVISLIDVTATTLAIAGVERRLVMQGRTFLGETAASARTYAFAARDRIDETEQRIRSAHDARFHYIRTYTEGPTFASLNRYKEKCFLIMPLMRQMHAERRLRGPPAELMERRGPCEELYDVKSDPHEIRNLVGSSEPEVRDALARLRTALDVWIVETGDRGQWPEPAEIVAPFAKEMHDWFGTPAWYQDRQQR